MERVRNGLSYSDSRPAKHGKNTKGNRSSSEQQNGKSREAKREPQNPKRADSSLPFLLSVLEAGVQISFRGMPMETKEYTMQVETGRPSKDGQLAVGPVYWNILAKNVA